MRHCLPLVITALTSFPVWANTEELPAALSRCDAAFFLRLHDQREKLTENTPIRTMGQAGYISVPDQRNESANHVLFTKPLSTRGLTIVGYFDEIIEHPTMGAFYSWGFLIRGSLSAVIENLRPVIWEANRLRREEELFVRSEVWRTARPQDGWRRENTEPGPPKPGTVERVLLVEPSSTDPTHIRFGCSLQGEVTRAMLRELRPDLGQ